MKHSTKVLSVFFLAFLAVFAVEQTVTAEAAVEGQSMQSGQKTDVSSSIDKKVQSDVKDTLSGKRKKVMEEAVTAITKTREALKALDKGDTDTALSDLELTTGKLDLIVARDPDLALAPVDVSTSVYDLYADVETINQAKKEVARLLKAGDVQDARSIISGLASEIVISEASIPLITYPIAIKEIVPLIDDGKIDEAKTALEDVLNTLVVVDHVIPLPIVRAQSSLTEAEKLAEKKDRSDEETEKLANLITEARNQLKIAEALGYGDRHNYSDFYQQLDELEMKTSGKKSGTGFFDSIKRSLNEHLKSFF